jgi:hypothetical protein
MRLTPRALVLAVALVATGALVSTGCTPLFNSCNYALFPDGLFIQVAIPPAPATYRLEIDAEGETLRITYVVDANGSAACREGCGSTGDRLEADPQFTTAFDDLQALVRLRGEDIGPAKVTVRVYRDDVFVAGATFEPDYVTDEPNGRSCGERVAATVMLEVG